MQIRMETPSKMETSAVKVDADGITITPVPVRGQHIVRALYLQATGDNGMKSCAVLLFNGNTGLFSVQRTDREPVKLAFDSPLEDFNQKRETRLASRKNRRSRVTQQKGNDAPTD